MYVLDSSALIELIERLLKSNDIIRSFEEEDSTTTSVCVHEVLAGVHSEIDRMVWNTLFSSIEVLQFDVKAAQISSQLQQELKREGKLINKMDILIAAICKASNATLITLDKDFEKIKGLNVKVIK